MLKGLLDLDGSSLTQQSTTSRLGKTWPAASESNCRKNYDKLRGLQNGFPGNHPGIRRRKMTTARKKKKPWQPRTRLT